MKMHNDTPIITARISGFEVHNRLQRESYVDVVSCITKKIDLLKSDMFPFGYSDELELNGKLLSYVDQSISLMFYIEKTLGFENNCSDCLAHTLLREFRNFNHHQGYKPIYPVKTELGIDFYVHHPFLTIPKISKLKWSKVTSSLTLLELVLEHQKYINNIKAKTIEDLKTKYPNKWIKFSREYSIFGVIGFGKNYLENLDKKEELRSLQEPPS